jgi:hypothetical protein
MAVFEQILLNMFTPQKQSQNPGATAQGNRNVLSSERRRACRECGERDGAEGNGISGERLFER